MLPQAEVYVYEDNKIIQGFVGAVSYTHLDVYKRQIQHQYIHQLAMAFSENGR